MCCGVLSDENSMFQTAYVQVFLKTSTAPFKAVKGTTEKIQVQLIVKKNCPQPFMSALTTLRPALNLGQEPGFKAQMTCVSTLV